MSDNLYKIALVHASYDATSEIKESLELFSVGKIRKCVVLWCNGVVTPDDCDSQSVKGRVIKQCEIVQPKMRLRRAKLSTRCLEVMIPKVVNLACI